MDDKKKNCLYILIFLGLFGFSLGLFDNFREMWLVSNGLTTESISHIISISYFVTVLCLMFFTLKIPITKIKEGIKVTLIVKIIIEIVLILLNNTNHCFSIKFLMFFDIAFSQLIVSSIYPLIMNFEKNDVIYTKKDFIESLSGKVGFLLATIIIGKSLGGRLIDYNSCLILSTIVSVLAILVLIKVKISNKECSSLNIKNAFKYFNRNKTYYFYLFVNMIASMIWATVLGMPMIILTQKFGYLPTTSSLIILILGVISNLLSIFVVKYLNFKNDYINLFLKFGVRLILYALTFIFNSRAVLLITIIYLFLTDCTYNFIFSSFFINKIEEKYSLLLTIFKYCSSLIGKSIGIYLCGLLFNYNLRVFILPTIVLSVFHIVLAGILVNKKKELVTK